MAKQQGIVTKIYELKTIGFATIHSQLGTLSSDLEKIKKQIIDLRGQRIGVSGKDLDDVNKKLIDATKAQGDLERKIVSANAANKDSLKGYYLLQQQYQVSKKNVEELAAAHGVESKEALDAAAAMQVYKQQLIDIHNLVKTGGNTKTVASSPVATSAAVPFTTNLGALEAEQASLKKTGETLSDLEREQAAAAISATEYANANKQAATNLEETGTQVEAVKTKYEEYTGSLRDNLRVQIENVTSLRQNRAQQKEIEDAIGSNGVASQAQIDRLAALKEQEQLLIETNKGLSVTVRNQAKEFIAATGSLDEMQAQLNQLQQSYEALTIQEKNSPFGTNLKNEIDGLEPKVKSLEAELGKFSRNVGNYPQAFGGAFNVLDKELTSVQAKLVSGDFSGKELDQLTAKQAVLSNVTQNLGTQFTTTSKEASAYKEAARQLATVFGNDSDVVRNFTSQVASGNVALKQTDQQIIKATGSGNKFSGALSSIFGGLRKIAYAIPGVGLAGLIGFLLTPIFALGSKIFELGTKALTTKDALKDLEKQAEITSKAVGESGAKYKEAIINVDQLRINLDLAKQGFISKKIVVDQYNESMGKVTGHVKDIMEVEAQLTKNADAYIQMTLLKAAANVALDESANKLLDAEKTRLKKITDFRKITDASNLAGAAQGGHDAFVAAQKEIDDKRKKRREDEVKNQQKEAEDLKTIAANFYKQAADIAKNFHFNLFGDTQKAGDKTKTDPFADQLRLIDAARLQQLAVENKRANEIQKVHELSFDEEAFHLLEIERINVEALNKKIALYQKEKKLNADKKKDLAQAEEEKSAVELETSKKLNELEKRRFDADYKDLKSSYDIEVKQIHDNEQAVLDNLEATELEKAQAHLNAHLAEEIATEKYYKDLLDLNENYNKDAVEKAREGIQGVNKEIKKDRNKVSLADIEDNKKEAEKKINEQEIIADKLRKTILDSDRLTAIQKQEQLDKLANGLKRTILTIELNQLNYEVAHKKELLAQSLISNADYQDAVKRQVKKAAELSAAQETDPSTSKSRKKFSLTDKISDLLGFDPKDQKNTEEIKAVGQILSDSYTLAQDAMASYFDAERQRIQENLQLQLDRLDMEKQQVEARAQSQAEIDSIEKQYAAKKKAAEKEAHDQLKKSKRSEAKIALATELANIAVQASEYPFPASLIIGGLLTALALGRYALRTSEINRETFAKGGVPKSSGGPISGPAHTQGGIPFNFEAEGGELAIVNKNSVGDNRVRTITGTNMQIASMINELGGGVKFSNGAKLLKFEKGGYLGDSLQAPIYVPTIFNGSSSIEGKLDELIKSNKEHADAVNAVAKAQGERIDKIKVHVVDKEITDAQKKTELNSAITTL
jgi:hypothetical protein